MAPKKKHATARKRRAHAHAYTTRKALSRTNKHKPTYAYLFAIVAGELSERLVRHLAALQIRCVYAQPTHSGQRQCAVVSVKRKK